MIPKVIHYCWFGRNPKSALAEKCIKSWQKYCRGYEIIEWNEDNFSFKDAPLYVRQAYEAKKWAFVTDYVRLYAMVNFGGVYMDTDVEVVKPLDGFLRHQAFSGFENAQDIQTGIMACEKGFPLFEEFLHYYKDATFFDENGSPNLTTNVDIITGYCKEKGLLQNNQYQEIDGFALYPNDFFCPVDFLTKECRKTENTVTVHWFSGSWRDEEAILKEKTALKKRKKRERNQRLAKIFRFPLAVLKRMLGTERYEKIRKKLK